MVACKGGAEEANEAGVVGLSEGSEAGGEIGWVGAAEPVLEDYDVLSAEAAAPSGFGAREAVGVEVAGGGEKLGEGVEDGGLTEGLAEGGEAAVRGGGNLGGGGGERDERDSSSGAGEARLATGAGRKTAGRRGDGGGRSRPRPRPGLGGKSGALGLAHGGRSDQVAPESQALAKVVSPVAGAMKRRRNGWDTAGDVTKGKSAFDLNATFLELLRSHALGA